MPERDSGPRGDRPRTSAERAADHAGVDRLTSELLPSLVARLAATGLGEVELREDGWRIRVRRPVGAPDLGRPATDRPGRAQPGHAGHGHAPGALEGHRAPRAGAPSTNGSTPGHFDSTSHGAQAGAEAGPLDGAVATSPAVGIFQPRPDLRPGAAVRAGDRLGVVDVLGISQEIVAPVGGILGVSLVEAGHAVEYGQDLLRIETTGSHPADRAPA